MSIEWHWQLEPMFGKVRWTILIRGMVIKQGFAPTHVEAQQAAEAALEEAEALLPRILKP